MSDHIPHIAIMASPAMGLLIPLVEFAKLLLTRFKFSITIFLPTITQPTDSQMSLLNRLRSGVSYTIIHPHDASNSLPPSGVAHELAVTVTFAHCLPSLRSALASLHPAALITDVYGITLFPIARELGIPTYLYFTTTAMCLLLFLNLPKLDEMISCEYRDMHEPLCLPGCVPVHGCDFMDAVQDREATAYKVVLNDVRSIV